MVWVLGYFLKVIPSVGEDVLVNKIGAYYVVVSKKSSDTIGIFLVDTSGNVVRSKRATLGSYTISSMQTLRVKVDSIYLLFNNRYVLRTDTSLSTFQVYEYDTIHKLTDLRVVSSTAYGLAGINRNTNRYFRCSNVLTCSGYYHPRMPSRNSKVIHLGGSILNISVYEDTLYIERVYPTNLIRIPIPNLDTLKVFAFGIIDTTDTAAYILANNSDTMYLIKANYIISTIDTIHITKITKTGARFTPSGINVYNDIIAIYGAIIDGGAPQGFIVIMDTSGSTFKSSKFNIDNSITKFFDPERYIAMIYNSDSLYILKTNANLNQPCNLGTLALYHISKDTTLSSLSDTTISDTASLVSFYTYSTVPYTLSVASICPLSYDSVRIVLTSPDSGAINVPFNANIGVWFSGSIDTTTVGSVQITGWDGATLRNYPFNYTCPTRIFCVLDPIQTFRPSEIITVDFRGIRDSSGYPIKPKVITFRTQEVDTTYPVIVFTIPDSGATGVPTNMRIGVKFSKEMDTTTINSSTVSIIGILSGSHGFSRYCPTLDYCVLIPITDFTTGETVTVDFGIGIRGLNGKNLVPKTVVFSVGSSDNVPPTIVIIENDTPLNDTIILYDNREPIKAYVSDNMGIHAVEWVFGSESFIENTNCHGETYGNPDTSCFRIPDVPTGTYLLRAYARDMSWSYGYDSIFVNYRDTVKPYVVFTDPQNGQFGVSPTTDIRIIFSENMDTSMFGYLKVRIGSNEYPYTHIWEDRRSLKVRPTVMLPYDSVVRVLVDSFVDLSGNEMMSYSFSFRIVSNASVNVRITKVEPDTVYYGSGYNTYIEGVISSAYVITDAKVIVDGNLEYSMIPKDGAFDEAVETVYVRVDLSGLNVGEHNVVLRGWNAYGYGDSEIRSVYVRMIGFLEDRNVIVYPNPLKGQGKLKLIVGGDAYGVIEIFDLKAKKVFSLTKNFKGFETNTIDLPKLPPGLYLLRVKANDKKVEKWFAVIK